MPSHAWVTGFPGAITVCDRDGIILEMNNKALSTFKEDGGERLIGQNVLDCHPEPARGKLLAMLKSGKKNVYTIEKRGIHKLIYQTPWYDEKGQYAGFLELSLEIPADMPHFIREE